MGAAALAGVRGLPESLTVRVLFCWRDSAYPVIGPAP